MESAVWLLLTVVFLAYANGANDNFKGVATLFGSRTMSYRTALWWTTVTTLAGSCAAVWVSQGLVKVFSGAGLVPEALAQAPTFLTAVGFGATLTVMLATLTGVPISTTHALTGSLLGAGLAAAAPVNLPVLGQKFFLPLAVSPIVSMGMTSVLYPIFRVLRRRLGVVRQMCLCVDGGLLAPVRLQPDGTAVLQATGVLLTIGQMQDCTERYHGRVLGIDSQWVLDRLHIISAGAVSIARGLNDTPKIVALLMAVSATHLNLMTGMMLIGIAMALGGLLHARRVATTMSQRITAMNHGQGFTANLATAMLVLVASRWGLSVSTTHVACGSLFGLGAVTRQGHWKTIRTILQAWVVTLPAAAVSAAGIYWMVQWVR